MAHEFTTSYLKDSLELFRYYKRLGERAMGQCPDEGLFAALDAESNSIAITVKHIAGNMRSRWADFLTTDGEKPDRNRDTEFEAPPKTRAELLALWEAGWKQVFAALEPLTDADLGRQVLIRTEPAAAHALCLSRGADRLRGEALRGRALDGADRAAQEIGGVQRERRLRESLPALGSHPNR
jgi:hypothetical protein